MFPRLVVFLSLMAFADLVPAAEKGHGQSQVNTVHRFVESFSAHDVDAMLEMLTDDVQWLSINGDSITVEADGKEQIRDSMTSYFASCSSCRSQVANVSSNGSRVTALETAGYETSDGWQKQQSLSVYEFIGGMISRVYYFPSE